MVRKSSLNIQGKRQEENALTSTGYFWLYTNIKNLDGKKLHNSDMIQGS